MTDQAEPTRTRAAAADPLPPTPGAPGEPPPTVAGPHLNPGTIALIVIAAIAVIFTLQAAQSVLIPIVIAVLISYAMGPLVTSLARHGVARAIGAALAVIVLFAAAGIGAYTLTDQVLQKRGARCRPFNARPTKSSGPRTRPRTRPSRRSPRPASRKSRSCNRRSASRVMSGPAG